MRLLFVTWDGPDTTYHETLFLPLLDRARRDRDEVHVLQFTWGAADRSKRIGNLASDLGMGFSAVPVPRWFKSASAVTMIATGARRLGRDIRQLDIDVVLARDVLPGAMVLVARRATGQRFALIYDADGLTSDERAEFGGWSHGGLRYRASRRIERSAVRRAEAVLVRTARAAEILHERTGVSSERFTVVVNAKDESVYSLRSAQDRQTVRRELGIPDDSPVVGYVGSIGPQYRPEAMIGTFRRVYALAPRAYFLLLTGRANHARMLSLCDGLPTDRIVVRESAPSEVSRFLAVADLGLAYRTSTLSQQAVAPIKVGEYLLCGVPVVYTAGLGDLDDQLTREVALSVGAEIDHAGVASWLLNDVMPNRDRLRLACRALGVQQFALDRGADTYRHVFDMVANPAAPDNCSNSAHFG